MSSKQNSMQARPIEARQVVRQFAWNLAGTLASAKAGRPAPQPAKPTGKR